MVNRRITALICAVMVVGFSLTVLPGTGSAEDTLPRQLSALSDVTADSFVRTDFTETRSVEALSRDITSRGWLLYNPGLGLVRVLEEPIKKIRLIKPNGTLVRQGSDGSLQTTTMDQLGSGGEYLSAFVYIMEGDREKIRELFQVSTETDGEKWVVSLTPPDGESVPEGMFERIQIRGRDGPPPIRQVTIYQGGDTIRITYENQVVRGHVTEAEREVLDQLGDHASLEG